MEPQAAIGLSNGPIARLVEGLGLKPYDQELLFGRQRNFPIGLKFIGSNESLLLLMQIRYPLSAAAVTGRRLDYEAEVAGLIRAGKLEISLEDKMAWLTIPDARQLVESNSILGIVNSVLATFEQEGFAGEPNKCHYCQAQTVETLTCQDGKVAQICPTCLEGKKKARAVDLNISSVSLTAVIGMGLLASLIGAVAWLLLWIGYDALVGKLSGSIIMVPRLVTGVLVAVAAFVVGGPVGFVIKSIPKRGDLVAGWLGIIFSIVSVVLGEILFVVWALYAEYKVISFTAALEILPRYLIGSSGFYLLIKVLTASMSVVVAYQFSRPKKRGLKL